MKRYLTGLLMLSIVLVVPISCTQTTTLEMSPTPTTETQAPYPSTQAGTYIDLSPEQAKTLIENELNLEIIDVSPHYDKGHLPRAMHYYLGDGSLDEAIPTLDQDKTYLVYCHVDSVAIQGAQKLVDAGFEMVYRLDGNYGAWVDAGYPVEK